MVRVVMVGSLNPLCSLPNHTCMGGCREVCGPLILVVLAGGAILGRHCRCAPAKLPAQSFLI